MGLPAVVLNNLTPLTGPSAKGQAPMLGRSLSVPVIQQDTPYWCWAAVASGIARFYGSSVFPQHVVAGYVLGRQCHPQGGPAACNCGASLTDALVVTDNFWQMIPRSFTLDEVVRSINTGRPLCVRCEDSNHSGHFVIIYGYSLNGTDLYIADPSGDLFVLPFHQFETSYRAIFTWSETYETKPHTDPPHRTFTPRSPPC